MSYGKLNSREELNDERFRDEDDWFCLKWTEGCEIIGEDLKLAIKVSLCLQESLVQARQAPSRPCQANVAFDFDMGEDVVAHGWNQYEEVGNICGFYTLVVKQPRHWPRHEKGCHVSHKERSWWKRGLLLLRWEYWKVVCFVCEEEEDSASKDAKVSCSGERGVFHLAQCHQVFNLRSKATAALRMT